MQSESLSGALCNHIRLSLSSPFSARPERIHKENMRERKEHKFLSACKKDMDSRENEERHLPKKEEEEKNEELQTLK